MKPAIVIVCGMLVGTAVWGGCAPATPGENGAPPPTGDAVPLKEAKLNIEHNATDNDTGFQGAIDSEGWQRLDVVGPGGEVVLSFEGQGELASLGLTELFFESVEPANVDVSIDDMLARLPAGDYVIEGPAMELGESAGMTGGTALLTHVIPKGPQLVRPAEAAVVPAAELLVSWDAVTESLSGDPIEIVSYQLIVEKDEEPHRHMIGKRGLSMYLPPSVTSIALPAGFLEPGTDYLWEVLAIEASGNQTLSSSAFRTE